MYRQAIEVIVEIANRDRCRTQSSPFVGFGNPAMYQPNGPLNYYITPYAVPPGGAYTTPFSNPVPARYITPYANPPVDSHPVENGQVNKTVDQSAPDIVEEDRAAHSRHSRTRISKSNVDGEVDGADAETKETAIDKDGEPMSQIEVDGFLALANGGVLPGQNDDSKQPENEDKSDDPGTFAPLSPGDTIDEALSRSDDDVLALITHISQDLITTPEPPHQIPEPNPYAASYSLMNSPQLGHEFKRLVEIISPEINTILPREQIQLAHLFYTHLVSCIHARNAANTRPAYHQPILPPPGTHHWVQPGFPHPPPVPPPGYMIAPVHWQHPSHFPQALVPAQTFVPRGNVVVPPVAKNAEAERKAAGFGFPPVHASQRVPSSRVGLRSGAGKRKRRSI